MIAACPKCSARYRIDVTRLRPEGSRLRCSRCEAVFRVRPPAQPAPQPVPAAPIAEPKEVTFSPPPAEAGPGPQARRERLVLVADPGVESGKATASALAGWGLEPILVHDGVEAILTIQRTLPSAVIIDAALPKMFGFQVCELLKRNESLQSIHVVLVGAIHHRERYRRPPTELYGADAYVERPQLPEALHPVLAAFGIPVTGLVPATDPPGPPGMPHVPSPAVRPPRPAPPREAAALPPVAAPEPASAPAPAAADLSAELAAAERLARIVVSDIVLYNQEKFDEAIRHGDVVQRMDGELREGRDLFAQRVDERVRGSRDFLGEELVRVAKQRGGA